MKKLMMMLACVLLTCSCRQTANKQGAVTAEEGDTARVVLKYAQGFKVDERDGFRLLTVTDPQREDSTQTKEYRFALVPRGTKPQDVPADCRVIETPVRGLICMTTLQLGGFIKLGALDHIVGIASAKRLFDKDLKARLDDGRIQKIGKEGNFDEEMVIASSPDAILISLSKRGGFDKLEDSGIPLIPYMGYQESSPLAQAEWIKFVGLLTGKTSEANAMFGETEKAYDEAKALVAGGRDEDRPTVIYGKMHGDNWYAMGGKSFIARIVSDAGGRYFMADDERTGGVNLDFEVVYAQSEKVDYWVIQNKDKQKLTYNSLKTEDARYADFRAWKEKKLVCCEMSHTPVNELSAMEPDVLLKDFIKAFHPDVLPQYEPKYYLLMRADSSAPEGDDGLKTEE